MTRYERAAKAADETDRLMTAIVDGINAAAVRGLTKPADVALYVRAALKNANFRIVSRKTTGV